MIHSTLLDMCLLIHSGIEINNMFMKGVPGVVEPGIY